ncbi:tetratricopeptide repeat protein [Pelagicoccus sp. SDUM812005]|uniref:tetratricopeptide repeat protein n=1 Tax=Pelagicoccus sp. SDUM812005 TaxID=3041257 RepID=UPI00280DA59A|nr:tetratricopeptide repeat protein [Pelagicoccus sp. SDUM812005]MDQ8181006.1 tetratricopeptide repeat protein [Pelagicoccus sp. SDUM812005]
MNSPAASRLVLLLLCSLVAGGWVERLEGSALPRLEDSDLGGDSVFERAYRSYWEKSGASALDALRLGMFFHANAFLHEAGRCYAYVADLEGGEVSDRAAYLEACVREELGEREAARTLLEGLLDRGLDYPLARLRLARLRESQGERVETMYEQCLEVAESFAGASIALAKGAMRAGKWKQAERLLQDCLQRDRQCGDAALLLANLYAGQGDDQRAQRYLDLGQGNPRHTSTRDPWLDEVRSYRYGEYRLSCDADELFTALRFEEAGAVLERGIRLYPESGELWLGLAKLEFASDRREAAFAAIEKAVSCADARAQAFAIYGEELYRDGKYEAALSICSRALEHEVASSRIALVEARCLRELGETGKAQEALESALLRFRFDAGLLEASGDLAREEGRWDLALARFKEASKGRPMDASLYAKRLSVAIQARAWDEAEAALDTLALRLPTEGSLARLKSQYWLARALDFAESGDRESWLGALTKAFESDRGNESLFRQVAAPLVGGEEWAALLKLVGEAKGSLAESVFVLKMEGVALLQLERYEEGVLALQAARKRALAQGEHLEAQRLAALIERLAKEADSV